MVLWGYGVMCVMVLWCCGVIEFHVVVLWCCGVMVLWYCVLCADGIVAYFMSFYRFNKQTSKPKFNQSQFYKKDTFKVESRLFKQSNIVQDPNF